MYQKANMILCCVFPTSLYAFEKNIFENQIINDYWSFFLTCSAIAMYNILKVNKRNSCLQTSKVTLT